MLCYNRLAVRDQHLVPDKCQHGITLAADELQFRGPSPIPKERLCRVADRFGDLPERVIPLEREDCVVFLAITRGLVVEVLASVVEPGA